MRETTLLPGIPGLWPSVILVGLLAWARPCRADNLGVIGKGEAILFFLIVFAALVVLFTIGLIILAVVLGRRSRAASPRGPVLVPVARGVVGLWYLLTLAPALIALQGGASDAAWTLLACLVGGIPAHIPSVVVLVRASALARKAREARANG